MKNRTNQSTAKGAISRRAILRSGSAIAAASALGTGIQAFPSDVRCRRGKGCPRDVFVQIFLRGGMDGLSTLVPYLESEYYNARPSIAIAPPGQPGGALDLDGFFGLNPNASALMTPFNAGHLAFVHACGSTDPTRSHFDSQSRIELGTPGLSPGSETSGWLARYLHQMTAPNNGILRGLGAGDIVPQSLAAAPRSLPIADLSSFRFPGSAGSAQERADALGGLYLDQAAPVGPAAIDSLGAIDLIAQVDFAAYAPAGGAQYPATPLGNRLRSVAALIKADLGVEAITIDFGGWDNHANQDPLAGTMANLLRELSEAMRAFYLDMLSMINKVSLVCMTEFGRRLEENGSLGTDHGHGSVMMAMGGGIQGGKVIADWPGLQPSQLDEGDLAVSIDYRDILGEILSKRLGVTQLPGIFQQHAFVNHGIAI